MPSLPSNLVSAALANGARAATGHYGFQRVTLRTFEPHERVTLVSPSRSDAASLYAVARRFAGVDTGIDADYI